MNDRFKFRFWNKTRKIMETFNDSPLTLGGLLLGKNDNYEILSCTGLKDKNGKLIYEGDIVQYKNEVYGLCIGKIEWDNAHYELQYYTGEKYGWFSHILCLNHIKNIEVIGNIYENPEQLERCK